MTRSHFSSGNVLYLVSKSRGPEVEEFLRHTARYHDSGRFKPIYCFFNEDPLAEWLADQGVQVEIFPDRLGWFRFWKVFAALTWVRERMILTGTNFVQCCGFLATILGVWLSRRERIPYAWFGPAIKRNFIWGFLFGRENTVSELGLSVDFREVEKDIGDPEAIPDMIGKIRGAWSFRESEFVVGMVCRLEPMNGVEIFIRALARARASTGKEDLRGVILTLPKAKKTKKDLEFEKQIRRLAENLDSGVHFEELQGSPLQKVIAMNAVVNADVRPEKIGFSLIEAMAVGRVPIAPKEGRLVEVIEDGKNGLFFSARSPEDLGRVIVKISQDANRYEDLAAQAFESARTQYDARIGVKRLEDRYSRELSKYPIAPVVLTEGVLAGNQPSETEQFEYDDRLPHQEFKFEDEPAPSFDPEELNSEEFKPNEPRPLEGERFL